MYELKKRLVKTATAFGMLGLLSIPLSAQAATVTFDLNVEFSGADEPVGTAPWLTATFDDMGTPGTVRLTMDSSGLTASEFVDEWLFNSDVAIDSFTYVSGQAADSTYSADAYKADGAGFFDLKFDFPASNSDRFGANETSIYDLAGTGITADTFNTLSTTSSKGQFGSAAHIQGIGDGANGSGWIGNAPAVPVPNSMLLFGTGLATFVFWRWKQGVTQE